MRSVVHNVWKIVEYDLTWMLSKPANKAKILLIKRFDDFSAIFCIPVDCSVSNSVNPAKIRSYASLTSGSNVSHVDLSSETGISSGNQNCSVCFKYKSS